jgi:Flp pilus assembly protein TadG
VTPVPAGLPLRKARLDRFHEPPDWMERQAVNAQRHRRIQIRNDSGQTMTEFALVLPVIVLLLFGIIQFGIAFNNYIAVTDAARTGARKAAVSRGITDPAGATEAAARASASGLDQDKLDVTVASSFERGSDVTVSTSYPYSISLLGLVVKTGRLESTTTERVE